MIKSDNEMGKYDGGGTQLWVQQIIPTFHKQFNSLSVPQGTWCSIDTREEDQGGKIVKLACSLLIKIDTTEHSCP